MESLVNSVKCAEIVSNELNRSVKREYISRLASDERIPYHLVEGKKYYKPSEVIESLPKERITSSNSAKREFIDQLDVIEHFQTQGVNISFDRKMRTKKSYRNDEEFNSMLPLMNIPTIDEVKQELLKKELSLEERNHISDELIEEAIKGYSSNYITLNTIWSYFNNRYIIQGFEQDLNIDCDMLNDNQKLMVFYILIEQYPRIDYIVDGIIDEIYSKV